MPDSVTNEPEVVDASATVEELNDHIDAELGLPKAENKEDVPTDVPDGDNGASDVPGEAGDSGDDSPAEGADADPAPDEVDGATTKAAPVADSGDSGSVDPEGTFITVQDAEGNDFKITKIEDLPEDFTPKNNRQVIEIINSLAKLETENVKAAEAQAVKEAADAQAARDTAQMQSWDSEVAEMKKQGRLDDIKGEKVDAVFKHMHDINAARLANNNPNLIRSFEDALDKYELAQSKTEAADAEKAESKLAKEKAGLIGGTPASGNSEAPAYFAGQATDIFEM